LRRVAGLFDQAAGDAEVGKHHPPVVTEVDVGGFDVAVQDADPVSCLQHSEQANADVRHLRDGKRALGVDHLGERSPGQRLHHDPVLIVVGHDVVDRDGSLVVDSGGGAGLDQETVVGS
jgi:hypothetical protein